MSTRGQSYGRTPAWTSWTPTPEPASTRNFSSPSASKVAGPRRLGLGGGEPVPRRTARMPRLAGGGTGGGHVEALVVALDDAPVREEEARHLLLRRPRDRGDLGQARPEDEAVGIDEARGQARNDRVVTIDGQGRLEIAGADQLFGRRVRH